MIFLLKTIVWLTVSSGIISSLTMNVMIRCAAFESQKLNVMKFKLNVMSNTDIKIWG